MKCSMRAAGLSPSTTLDITARAAALRAQGLDVIGFGAGEPDFPTPAHVVAAGQQALAEGYTRYTATAGLPGLRNAIVEWHRNRHGLAFTPDQVTVSCGGKHAVMNVCMCLLDPGDQVLLPSPYWVSYPEMVRLAGAEPVLLPLTPEEGFKLTPEALAAAITPRTKLLILNSPSNPTGAAYEAAELTALAAVLARHEHVFVLSDDIYADLLYDRRSFASILHVAPQLAGRTVVVNGVSKAFSMTGWRLGWSCAPAALAQVLTNYQSHTTSNAAAVSQRAAEAALRGPTGFLDEWVVAFERRRNRMVAALNDQCGLPCRKPEGAFYAFADARPALRRLARGPKGAPQTTAALAAYLLDQAQVAVIPGEAFGAPGFLRLSYATSDANIQRGLERVAMTLA